MRGCLPTRGEGACLLTGTMKQAHHSFFPCRLLSVRRGLAVKPETHEGWKIGRRCRGFTAWVPSRATLSGQGKEDCRGCASGAQVVLCRAREMARAGG